MNGLSKGRRGSLVLAAGAIMTIALASGAWADPGDQVWTTRPLSDASYVPEGDLIPSTRVLSDASFSPTVEPVALNRVLSDASYHPTVPQPEVSPAGDSGAASFTDGSDVLPLVGLLAVIAGAAGLIAVFVSQRRPAVRAAPAVEKARR